MTIMQSKKSCTDNKGFKQSEVGLIPEDWEVVTLETICVQHGMVRGPFGGALKKAFFIKSGYKVYEQKNAIYKDEEIGSYYVSQSKFEELRRFEVKPKDFIISCSGTIGRIFQMPESFEKGIINQALLKLTLNIDNISDQYFYQYFQWCNFQERIIDNTQGGAMKNLIGISDFRRTTIPLPPTLTEQRAIATALSDMDDLIEAREQLIAKKRAIKQGAMQELLKPKEGWEVKVMSEIGKTYGGLSGKAKRDFENGNSQYIPFMNVFANPVIDTAYFDSVHIRQGENQNSAQNGDLFFNGSSETPEEVGMCSVLMEDIPNLYLNSFCFGFRFHKDVEDNGLFLSYYFRSDYGREKMYLLAQGATRFNLSKSNFLRLEIAMPGPNEQTHIATILSDMDAEIEQLEAGLAKYREIKQGMMQELLTGKKRLV